MRTYTLAQPKTCVIEPVTLSGLTESGLYVLDHDNERDMGHKPFSILVRVLQTSPDCQEAQAGKVYIVEHVYNYVTMEVDGKLIYIMGEDNLLAEAEGYDDEAHLLQQEFDDQPERYGVCAK